MLLFFVVANLDLSRPPLLRRAAWLSVGVAVIVAAWGLKQRFLGLNAAEQLYAATVGTLWVEGTELRMFSTLRVPWAFAAYVAAASLVAVSLALGARTVKVRLLAWGAALSLGVTVILSLMRGALVGYAIGLLLLMAARPVRHRGRRTRPMWSALVAVAALAAVVMLPASSALRDSDDVLVQRLLAFTSPLHDEAMLDRFFAWADAGAIVLSHPLGLGLGTTAGVSERYEGVLHTGPIHTDNVYLAAFVETGWLGGVLLVLLTLWIFAHGCRVLSGASDTREASIRLGILAALVMFTTASLATPVVWEPGTSHLYWAMAGVLAGWRRGPWREAVRRDDGRRS
jgi:O-antigen ligase